ncbi:ATP-binding cassette domain-containing protein [Glutamicibacter arilaitensis]|uniref:AAA family ATPase n=1 Tax=Glutamicibacter arilaitensis TaxID=256701 RepID=UPI00384AB257
MNRSDLFLPVRRIEAHEPNAELRAQWPMVMPPVRQLLLEGLDLGQITVMVGENGVGKSTLLEALAISFGLNAEGGSTGAMHATRASESSLSQLLKLHRGAAASRKGFFLRAETMHSFYTYLEESRVGSALHERSHGESFLDLVGERANLKGLWLLDEPESALSLAGCVQLVEILRGIVQRGSQVVISTHSPVLAAFPGAKILEVGAWGFRESEYDQLELVRNWREFFTDPQSFLDTSG